MNTKLILICVILTTLFSCKQKETVIPSPTTLNYIGSVTANRNGLPWSAKIYAGYRTSDSTHFSIEINRFSDDAVLTEIIGLRHLSLFPYSDSLTAPIVDSLGQTVEPSSSTVIYLRYYEDGDVASLPYNIMASEPHDIEVTGYDPITKEVAGKFQISFIKGFTALPDTIRFTDGRFFTVVQ